LTERRFELPYPWNQLPPSGVTINRTGPHRAGSDWLFHFDDCYKKN